MFYHNCGIKISFILKAWIIGPTVGSLTDAAIAQGSIGYCPNDKKTNVYFYNTGYAANNVSFQLFYIKK